jgi:hypothetical protein
MDVLQSWAQSTSPQCLSDSCHALRPAPPCARDGLGAASLRIVSRRSPRSAEPARHREPVERLAGGSGPAVYPQCERHPVHLVTLTRTDFGDKMPLACGSVGERSSLCFHGRRPARGTRQRGRPRATARRQHGGQPAAAHRWSTKSTAGSPATDQRFPDCAHGCESESLGHGGLHE